MKESTADSRPGDASAKARQRRGFDKLNSPSGNETCEHCKKSMGKKQPDNTIAVNGTINAFPRLSEQILAKKLHILFFYLLVALDLFFIESFPMN